MMDAVTTALSTIISWIGTVIDALIGTAGATGAASTAGALSALLPLLAVGIAISAFLFAMKAIRSVTWGA